MDSQLCFIVLDRCPGFVAANTDPGGQNCTVSVLTVNVNQVSDGICIRCLNDPFMGDTVEIGNASVIKKGRVY